MIENDEKPAPGFAPLKRFLVYLWPKDAPMLRLRVVLATSLVLIGMGATFANAYALKWAINVMTPGNEPAVMLALAFVLAYAGGRFASVVFDNLRNAIFERVGQDATRRLAERTFRHLHDLSLRFHLDRRTGAVTKVIERGTKSIDTMLYFLLFNIAPTVIQLIVVMVIFGRTYGLGLVFATLIVVALYISFTRIVTDWRVRWIPSSIMKQ
jgi:ATP-binding cassette subfamily B protein